MMTQFGPILVATDFSAHARHATARAARLAHDTHSALTLMHVVTAQPMTKIREWLGASSVREQKECDEAYRQLHQLASEVSSVRRVEFEIEAAAGSAADEIVRAAERVDAQLLVLGARGAGFLRRLVLGTTSQRLARRTDRPLLVVRRTAKRSYRRVLVAVDFSPRSRHALILARRVAPIAKLALLTVFEVPFEGKLRFAGVDDTTVEIYRQRARDRALQQLHALAHEAGLSPAQWELCVAEGNASRRIIEQEQARNCDLVVLAPGGQSATADLLLGSVTRHVLAEGHVDVLLSTQMPGQPIRPWEGR